MTSASSTLPRLGIDISKLTFDVHLCTPDGRSHSAAFANNHDGFALLDAWLAQHRTTSTCAGRMSKEGSTLLRKMLYMAALQAVKRPSNAFHPVYTAFVARGKAKMCALGALMHKILRIAFGVLKHDTPFVPNFAQLHA